MKLYDFLKISDNDYDAYDDVYDISVTTCRIYEDDNNDDYDNFCIDIMKKVDVVKVTSDITMICKWSDLIERNLEKFKAFTSENWEDQYEDDKDEFIYQWIKEIHLYMAGYVSEDYYKTLVDFVSTLE